MIGAKIGEGREAEIFAWGDDAVLKLYRPGLRGHYSEVRALATLAGQAAGPRLLEVIEHDGRVGLVLERVAGTDMLSVLQRKPLRVPGFARALAATQLTIHRLAAPKDLACQREILAARIEEGDLPLPLRDYARSLLDRLPDGDRLCHGDYHPGNVLVSQDKTSVIDWATATRGVPEADHARTILLLRWADPMPGTPLIFRGVIAAGRSMLTRIYAKEYRRASPQPLQHMDSWLTVVIAARLAEGFDTERPQLLDLLHQAIRRR